MMGTLMILAFVAPVAGEEDTLVPHEMTIFDFLDGAPAWPNIDDVVMGGVSRSAMKLADGVAVFSGVLSLENNGGFASIRSRPDRHDLSGYAGVALRIRGDGKTYGLRLRTTAAFDGVSYHADLESADGGWVEVRIPFDAFRPVFRGRLVPSYPPLALAEIRSFGFIIAQKQAGPFRLEVDWIGAYR